MSSLQQRLVDIFKSNWYGICVGAILSVWLVSRLLRQFLRRISRIITVSFLKYVSYRSLPALLQFFDVNTALDALWVALGITVNALSICLRTTSVQTANSRAGAVALLNLVVLFLGGQPSVPTNWLGVQAQTNRRVHRWIARICATEVIAHSCISLSNRWKSSGTIRNLSIPAITAAGCVLLVVPLTLRYVMRYGRWLLISAHQVLGYIAAAFLWMHLAREQTYYQWILIAAVCAHIALRLLYCALSIWRNKRGSAQWPRAFVTPCHGVLKIRLKVPQQWSAQPGQTVQLWCYGLGMRACCQTLPLTVAYIEDEKGHRVLHFFTRPGRRGLSRRLAKRHVSFQALAFGPYGHSVDFSGFVTVLLLATDVGIAAILPYVKHLIDASRRRQSIARKVEVIWQINDYAYTLWLPHVMQELLDQDRKAEGGFEMIQFHIFYRKNPDEIDIVTTSRIHSIHGPLDVEHTVESHLVQRQGNMAIAVCASSHVTQRVREVVQNRAVYNLRLVELDPEPHVDEMRPWTTCTTPPSAHHQHWIASRIKEGESQLEHHAHSEDYEAA